MAQTENKEFDRVGHMRKVAAMGREAKAGKEAIYKENPEERPLNANQQKFCYLYVFDPKLMGKAAECYSHVYNDGVWDDFNYSKAGELLKKANVKAEIAALKEDRDQAYEHIKYSNIETLLRIRDEMTEIASSEVSSELDVKEDGEVGSKTVNKSTHMQRMTAIRSIETLNKMLGFNKATESKVKHEMPSFTFNLIKPEDQKKTISLDDGIEEAELADTEE